MTNDEATAGIIRHTYPYTTKGKEISEGVLKSQKKQRLFFANFYLMLGYLEHNKYTEYEVKYQNIFIDIS